MALPPAREIKTVPRACDAICGRSSTARARAASVGSVPVLSRLVTMVAVLHHLPLAATLRELRAALRPGGRLVVVGCHREDGAGDWPSHCCR